MASSTYYAARSRRGMCDKELVVGIRRVRQTDYGVHGALAALRYASHGEALRPHRGAWTRQLCKVRKEALSLGHAGLTSAMLSGSAARR